MTITSAQQHDLYKLAVGLYQAAPGTHYLGVLADSLAAGVSLAQVYDALAGHASFQGQAPDFGDAAPDERFARQFVENLAGDSTPPAAKDAMAAYLASLLPGSTRSAVMKLAVDLLDAVDESDATWGAAAARLHNRIEAARYYTETLQGADTDLATLQTKIAGVTSDAATVTAVNQANELAANPDASDPNVADPAAEPEVPASSVPPGAPPDAAAVGGPADDVQANAGEPADGTPEPAGEAEPAAAEDGANVVPHDDTVTVADHSVMSLNSRADSTPEALPVDSYLNYDLVNADDVSDRLSLAELRAGEEAFTGDDAPEACNVAQFSFNLGGGNDTVDYSNETARIASVVGFDLNDDLLYVMVDGNDSGGYDDAISDRVDRLVDVENVVAAQGWSILDVTNSDMNLAITFSREITTANGYDVHRVQMANLDTDVVFGMNFLEYRDNNVADADPDIFAVWNEIEGGDFNEKVELTDAEAEFDHSFYLRGGDNEVNYNELTRSIALTVNTVSEWDEDNPLSSGLIQADVLFTDGNLNIIGGEDFISSYTAQNGIAAGSLRIEASQDAEDSMSFAAGLTKLFILGEVVDGSDQITVIVGDEGNENSIVLTGFELLQDAPSDDVYTMEDLQRVINNLTLVDNITDDTDTILVFDDAIGFQAAPANTISLEVLNLEFNFDFDILDVTTVTSGNLLLLGDTNAARDLDDAVRVGDLDLIDDVSLFPTIIFTDASIASAGDAFHIDIAAGEFEDDGGNVLFTFDPTLTTFDFSEVSPDTDLTITVFDPAAVGVTIITDGQDNVTGGAGDDTLIGGGDADVLDGGISAEIRTVELSGILDAAANTVTMTMGNAGWVLTVNEAAAPADADPTDDNLDILQGSGADAVGAALALLVNANLTDINGVADAFEDAAGNDIDLLGASYDSATNLLTFTFRAGSDVDLTDAIVVTDSDAGTFAASADTTVSGGGDGGSDTFVYNDESESTQASMDQLPFFTIDGATGSDDVINLSALELGGGMTNGGNAFNFESGAVAFGGNSVFVASDGTDGRVYVDANDDNSFDSGDMVIELGGVTDMSGMSAAENFLF